jgi:hypothetical protein
MLLAPGCQAWKVLPVGNAAAARRVANAERSRPAASSPNSARSAPSVFAALDVTLRHLGGAPTYVLGRVCLVERGGGLMLRA